MLSTASNPLSGNAPLGGVTVLVGAARITLSGRVDGGEQTPAAEERHGLWVLSQHLQAAQCPVRVVVGAFKETFARILVWRTSAVLAYVRTATARRALSLHGYLHGKHSTWLPQPDELGPCSRVVTGWLAGRSQHWRAGCRRTLEQEHCPSHWLGAQWRHTVVHWSLLPHEASRLRTQGGRLQQQAVNLT